jgi:hypothetical protein
MLKKGAVNHYGHKIIVSYRAGQGPWYASERAVPATKSDTGHQSGYQVQCKRAMPSLACPGPFRQLLKADFVWSPWLKPHEMANGTVFTYDAARCRPGVKWLKLWPVVPGGLLQVKFTHAP